MNLQRENQEMKNFKCGLGGGYESGLAEKIPKSLQAKNEFQVRAFTNYALIGAIVLFLATVTEVLSVEHQS